MRWWVLALALALLGGQDAVAQSPSRRVALVIGNAAYSGLPALPNPAADARLLGQGLTARGFEVTTALDLDTAGMRAALDTFRAAAAGADVALVYYSGHGLQVDGVNFLLPVTTRVDSRADLAATAVTLPDILRTVEQAGATIGVVVLDACRDNPLAQQAGEMGAARSLAPRTGLARMPPQRGMLIAYATAPGQVALDGPAGQNSPFAAALARFLDEPGLEIGLLFRKVSERVRAVTGGAQVPWTEAALSGESVYLNPPRPAGPIDAVAALNLALATEAPAERRLALVRFTAEHPTSALAIIARDLAQQLARDDDVQRVAATAVPEATLEAWQRVGAVQGTAAEPLALDAFLAINGSGELAERARQRKAQLPARLAALPPGAASDVWPLVAAAGRRQDLGGFVALFGAEPQAQEARARLALLDAPVPVPATAPAVEQRPLIVASFVGTGPAPIDVPGMPGILAVVQPPRHGSLVTRGGRGLAPTVGDTPQLVQTLAYEPHIEARNVVDELVLRVGDQPDAAPLRVQVHVEVHPCDELAGARFDTQGAVAGRYPNEIDPVAAIPACKEAVARFPDVARFLYQEGRALEAARRFAEAATRYEQAAGKGHVVALSGVGGLYETGSGFAADPDRAAAYYESAAGKGDPLAMNALGRAYRDGRGRPKDRDRAVDWFLQAASRGHTFAYNNLGTLLAQEGQGDRAIVLFRASAEQGDVYGYNNLGWAYENGVGVTRNLEQAVAWYEKAAQGGQPNAPINLGFIFRDGRPGIAADPAEAARWFAQGASRGIVWGHVHLAALYAAGRLGPQPDPQMAARILARAAVLDRQGEAGKAARAAFAALPEKSVIAALQTDLGRRGYDVGTPDGVMGARSRTAIRSFAAAQRLSADAPPIELLAALQLDAPPAAR